MGIPNEELFAAVCLMDMYWGIFLIINLCGWILSAVTRAIVEHVSLGCIIKEAEQTMARKSLKAASPSLKRFCLLVPDLASLVDGLKTVSKINLFSFTCTWSECLTEQQRVNYNNM